MQGSRSLAASLSFASFVSYLPLNLWAFGIAHSRVSPTSKSWMFYILLLFTGSETNPTVLMKHKLYQWQQPVLEAA